MKRSVIGTIAALVAMAAVTSVMLPLRSHLSIATTALILIVPVVIGVVWGGFSAGLFSVVTGFLVYDFFFIPPYLTLLVGAPQNWVALGVYVVVMLPVAKVVAGMNAARARERRQAIQIRELFELSGLLVEDKPLEELLSAVVTTVADVFGARQVALFLPRDNRLEVAESAGEPLTAEQRRSVLPAPGATATLRSGSCERGDLLVVALAAAARPVGLLVLSAEAAARHEREPLLAYANQIALALERAQLREQALAARLTEEVARLAKTLVAAVAHDLRAPLALIKASSSTLADSDLDIGPEARGNLVHHIDAQADRLADLVRNLLDMSRIQAGVLEPRRAAVSLGGLVSAVVRDLTSVPRPGQLRVQLAGDVSEVDVDPVLISRVLANVLENALRHSPKGAPVTVSAAPAPPGRIVLSVTDQGPGVDPQRRDEVFELFARRPGDTGAGLGLTIAKTFIEAHGERIWVESAPSGGARFCFTLPAAPPVPEEPHLAADTDH